MLPTHFWDVHGHTEAKRVFIVFAFRTVAAFGAVIVAPLWGREGEAAAAAEGGAVMVHHAFPTHHP